MPLSQPLAIGDYRFPAGSYRGVTETRTMIPEAFRLRRTVNGGVADLSRTVFRKYRIELQCADMHAPALDGVWGDEELTVDTIGRLVQTVAPPATTATLIRPPVAGSLRGYDTAGAAVAVVHETTAAEFAAAVAHVSYRPRLTMHLVEPPEVETDPHGAAVGWSLALEEV